MIQKIKRILAILIAISFVVALTTTAVSAVPPPGKVPTFTAPPVVPGQPPNPTPPVPTPPVVTGQPPETTPPVNAPPFTAPPVDIGI